MRRLVLAALLGAAGLLVPPGAPAVAQPMTTPGPDFDNDGFGDLAQGAGGVPGASEAGDRFGASLSAPFFHESDVLEDLGAGAPGETVGGRAGAGAVSVLFGSGVAAALG
jgi:hypothetical protein